MTTRSPERARPALDGRRGPQVPTISFTDQHVGILAQPSTAGLAATGGPVSGRRFVPHPTPPSPASPHRSGGSNRPISHSRSTRYGDGVLVALAVGTAGATAAGAVDVTTLTGALGAVHGLVLPVGVLVASHRAERHPPAPARGGWPAAIAISWTD